jgi:hypothetical protein
VIAVGGATAISVYQSNTLQEATNSSKLPFSFKIQIKSPKSTSFYKEFSIVGASYQNAGGGKGFTNVGGNWGSAAAVTSIQILLRASAGTSPTGSTVNAVSGTWTLKAVN